MKCANARERCTRDSRCDDELPYDPQHDANEDQNHEDIHDCPEWFGHWDERKQSLNSPPDYADDDDYEDDTD